MVDLKKLNSTINQSGLKLSAISDKMGVNRTTLYNKVSGKTEFNASEIEAFAKVLHLSEKDRNSIFFAKQVVKDTT